MHTHIQYTYAHVFSRRDCANACALSLPLFLSLSFFLGPSMEYARMCMCTRPSRNPSCWPPGWHVAYLYQETIGCHCARDGYAPRADRSDKKGISPKIHFFPWISLRTFRIMNVAFSRWILFFKFCKMKDKNGKINNQLIRWRYMNMK